MWGDYKQVFCRRLNQLGCILPSPKTAASVSSAALLCQYGNATVSSEVIQSTFETAKRRLKKLYKGEPTVFIEQLPATPAELLRQTPELALSFFSRDEPPVSCPLQKMSLDQLQSRVVLRGCKQLTLAAGSSVPS